MKRKHPVHTDNHAVLAEPLSGSAAGTDLVRPKGGAPSSAAIWLRPGGDFATRIERSGRFVVGGITAALPGVGVATARKAKSIPARGDHFPPLAFRFDSIIGAALEPSGVARIEQSASHGMDVAALAASFPPSRPNPSSPSRRAAINGLCHR
jgi:hypothetical protein